jgi:hypothetical protein
MSSTTEKRRMPAGIKTVAGGRGGDPPYGDSYSTALRGAERKCLSVLSKLRVNGSFGSRAPIAAPTARV